MEDNIIQPLAKTAEHGTSAIDKFMGIIKNRSDLKYNRELKELEKTSLQETIDIIENANIPIVYNKDGLGIINPQMQLLLERTSNRLKAQEILKQVNIESVLEKTQTVLEENKINGDDTASEEPINNDFLTQFINGAGEISDQDMQQMWAKLLAGEIKQPRTFSLRTIQKMKVISSNEAILFEKISPFIIDNDYIPNDAKFLQKYNVNYSDLMILQDCGILSLVKTSKYYNSDQAAIYNNKISVFNKMFSCNDENISIEAKVFPLSQFGKELNRLIKVHYDDNYFYEFLNRLKSYQVNSANIKVSCYEINNRYNGKIEYISSIDLLKEYNENLSIKKFTDIMNKVKKK